MKEPIDIEMNNKIENAYLNSFIRETEHKGNRLNRFIKQVKINIFEFIKKNDFLTKDLYQSLEIYNIQEYIHYCLSMVYMYKTHALDDTESLFKINMKNLLEMLCIINEPKFTIKDNEYILEYLESNNEKIYKIIDQCFYKECIEYIAYFSAINDNINEFNYFKLLMPTDDVNLLKILNNVIQNTCIEINQLFLIQENLNSDLGKENEDLMNQISNKNIEIEKLKNKLYNKEQSIVKLNDIIIKLKENQHRKIKEETEEFKIKIAELNKIIKNSENENKILKTKLKNEIETKKIEEKISVNETTENSINFKDLKILFVTSDSSTFINDLKNTFPKCKIVYRNFSSNLNKFDYVIVITTHIDHSTYNTIKEKCKNTNTTFLHCTYTNVEKIKELILSQI